MQLTDVDALRKQWKVAEKCEDCNQDTRYCGGNLYGSQMYSLRDICGSLDDAPIIDAIPVEYLKNLRKDERLNIDDVETIDWILCFWEHDKEGFCWQKA